MAQDVNYGVNAFLRVRGGFIRQMARHAAAIGPVHKKLTNAGRATVRWGQMVEGGTARAVVGWTKVGVAMGAVAGTAGFGALLRRGFEFNETIEQSTLQAATMFQLFDLGATKAKVLSGEITQWEQNLLASKGVMQELFEIAKKSPAKYQEIAQMYQMAAPGLAAQTQDLARHIQFMERASKLGGLTGGDTGVLGAQLGRIIAGSAGAEMNTWKALLGPLQEAAKAQGLIGKRGFFSKSAASDMQKFTEEFNRLGGDTRLEMMMKAMEAIGPEVAAAFANSMAGITSTTASAIDLLTGTATAPLREKWREFLIRLNKDAGVFGKDNMHKWVSFAEQAGMKLAEFGAKWLVHIEQAAVYIRDNWVTIMQAGKNAGIIAAAAIKGAFFIGVARMMTGAAMVSLGRGMQAAGAAKRGSRAAAGFLGRRQKEAHIALIRGGKGRGGGGLGMLGKGAADLGKHLRGLMLAIQLRGGGKVVGVLDRMLGKGTFREITKFLASTASFAIVIGAGIPIIIGAGLALGAVFTIIGGLAAYIVSNWRDIASSIREGLTGGQITLRPLLVALLTFWTRLKMVGEAFLGGTAGADMFNTVLNATIFFIEALSDGIAIFVKVLAFSLGVWGALKTAFLALWRIALAIIESTQFLPGMDATVAANARASYEEFKRGVQDTFTESERLTREAEKIANFRLGELDLAKIDKQAKEMEKAIAESLKPPDGKGKKGGPRGPQVKIGKVEIIQDLRDTDPDRLMAAFIKPLQRMADQRVQAFDTIEDGI